MSSEIQKNINFPILILWPRGYLHKISQDNLGPYFLMLLENIQFFVNIKNFEGVSPQNELRNPKKIDFAILIL